MSKFSKWHLSITPSKCIQCKLCTTSCPFEAIDYPTDEKVVKASLAGVKKFLAYAILIPAWVLLGGYAGSKAHTFLSKAHPDVYLAELLIKHPELKNDPDNVDIQTFMASGKTMDTLVEDARQIRSRFYTGGWFLGGFIGLVIGLTLLNQVVYRRKEDYTPDRGNCYSCARCIDYCPVEK